MATLILVTSVLVKHIVWIHFSIQMRCRRTAVRPSVRPGLLLPADTDADTKASRVSGERAERARGRASNFQVPTLSSFQLDQRKEGRNDGRKRAAAADGMREEEEEEDWGAGGGAFDSVC